MIARDSYKEKIQSAFGLVPIVVLIGVQQVKSLA